MMKPLDYSKVGLRIRTVRRGLNITQEELAEKSGITKWYISKIELGLTKPRLETYYNIAESLNVTIDTFIYDSPILEKKNFSDDKKEFIEEIMEIFNKYHITK